MMIFMRLWFAFVAVLAVSFVGFAIWALVLAWQAEPEDIGEFFGKIVSGYEQAK